MKRLLFCVVASTLLAGCSGDKAPPPEPTKESFYEATKSISEDLTVDDKQAFEKCCETINTRGKELLIGFKAGPEPARVVAVEGGHSIEVSIRDQLESSYTFMTPEQIEHRQESQILQTMLYAAYLCDDVLSFNRKRSLKWFGFPFTRPSKMAPAKSSFSREN